MDFVSLKHNSPSRHLAAVLATIIGSVLSAPAAPDVPASPDVNSFRLLSATNLPADAKLPAANAAQPKAVGPEFDSMRMLAQAAPAPADAPAKAPTSRSRGTAGGPPAGADPLDAMQVDGDKVSLQFPNNTITDILGIYERLTNKTLVKDTNIFDGQTISLVTPQPVDKAEAIKLIEASMLTNGYIIVADPEGKSARILPTRAKDSKDLQFSQGVKFYQSAKELPENETIVSYFMKLDHLDPAVGATMLSSHVGLNIYGRITPVSVPAGLLITESATIVRQLVNIKEVIDASDVTNALITKFIPLKYADAVTVAQIIQATLDAQAQDKEQKGMTTIRGSGPSAAAPASGSSAASLAAQASASGGIKKPQAKSQVVADGRLNQLLVVAEPDNYAYVVSLITEFDKPVEVPEAYERQLKNIFAVDVLSVLADLLKETAKGGSALPGGGSLASQQSQITASNSLLTGRNSANNQRGGSFINAGGAAAAGGTGTTSGAGKPDQLIEAQQDNAPIGVLVNKTRIIADPLANSVIVIGPKEDKDKVKQLLDKLDRKPPQVYMATVIGQLTLGDGMNFGIDYLQHFNKTGSNSGVASSFIQTRGDIVTNKNVADLRNNAITSLIAPAAAFNVYGQISSTLDTFVTALETSNDFKVISRPSVFALNNRKAVITSGQSVPVPESIITQAVSNNINNTGNTTTNVTYKDVVLKLEVIPLINPDGLVTLKIAQVNDTLQGERIVGQNSVPIIGTEQITTTVTVPSGKTIVLGGLITEQEKKDIGGIPGLHRIPLLGPLFRHTTKTKQRSELLIFIQPTVVNGDAEMFKASLSEDLRTDVGADAYKTFPDKVWPKAFPVEDSPAPQPQASMRREMNR